jgi:flagellar protein FliS
VADKQGKGSTPEMRNAMYTSPAQRFAQTYSRQATASRVAAADPHELIAMLFEAVDESLLAAQGALERGDIPAKCAAISKAVRIVDEGLRAALDPKGGELTDNLDALYDYCVRRLTEANLRNDAAMVQEVRGLLAPVAEAWNQIRTNGAKG